MPRLGEVDFSSGGYYQLSIELGTPSEARLRAALQTLWAQAELNGCYLRSDLPPMQQQRLVADPAQGGGWLYGEAHVPDGKIVPCGTYAVAPLDTEPEVGDALFSLDLPIGGLASAYSGVGAFPFAQQPSRHWREPLENWLAALGRRVFAEVPFKLAMIGFEVGGPSFNLPEGRIPEQRWIGYLMPAASGLAYYGTNCWDAPFAAGADDVGTP